MKGPAEHNWGLSIAHGNKVWANGWDNAYFHAVMPGSPAPAADFVKHAEEWAAQREWNHPCTAATAAAGKLPHTCPGAKDKSCSTEVGCKSNCDDGFGACGDGKGVYYCRDACTGTYACPTNKGLLDYACNPPPSNATRGPPQSGKRNKVGGCLFLDVVTRLRSSSARAPAPWGLRADGQTNPN